MTDKSPYNDAPENASEIQGLPKTAIRNARPGPPGGARDTNRREKVRALVDAALGLFLDRGIEATTIDEITKAAGVAKGSFYRYFASKEELVEFLVAPLLEAVRSAFAACTARLGAASSMDEMLEAYEDLGAVLARAILAHDREVLLYLQESRGPGLGARAPVKTLHDEITRGALALTDVAHARGLLRAFPSTVSALAAVGAGERLLHGVLKGEDVGDPLTLTSSLSSLILDGIAAPGLARRRR